MSDCPCSKCILGGIIKIECRNQDKEKSFQDKLFSRSRQIGGGDDNVREPVCSFDDLLKAKAESAALSRKNYELQQSLSAKDMQMTALANTAKSFEQMIYDMRAENSSLRNQTHEAKDENKEMQRVQTHLQTRLRDQDEEMRQILIQLQDQDKEMRRLQNENQEIISDIQRLRPFQTEACKLATENMALKTQNAMLMNKFLDMQLKLSAATGESQSKENDDEVVECVICMDKPKTVFFKTCGHVSCCEGCSNGFESCQICRKKKNKDDLTNGYSSFVRLPKCCTCKKNMPNMWCSKCKHMSICSDCSSASSHPTCANCNQTGKLTTCFFS